MKLRPRAEAMCFKDNKVLCHWKHGYVCFPGGGVDVNESPVKAAKREFMEEADRVLMNCTVAHEPTTQIWPEGYSKKEKWAKGFEGGLTFWMTGTTFDNPTHANASQRHADYEADFAWQPISEVLSHLKAEADGKWADDVQVRRSILETHLKMHAPYKAAWPNGLRLSNSLLGVA
ncbi:MAG: NUDIX domain-containing protein [Phycisphaerae bacterium]|jgi:ADP-ribose pyrophosphatase YjhB (NUDIX family)